MSNIEHIERCRYYMLRPQFDLHIRGMRQGLPGALRVLFEVAGGTRYPMGHRPACKVCVCVHMHDAYQGFAKWAKK